MSQQRATFNPLFGSRDESGRHENPLYGGVGVRVQVMAGDVSPLVMRDAALQRDYRTEAPTALGAPGR
jgi:hypothetical protein